MPSYITYQMPFGFQTLDADEEAAPDNFSKHWQITPEEAQAIEWGAEIYRKGQRLHIPYFVHPRVHTFTVSELQAIYDREKSQTVSALIQGSEYQSPWDLLWLEDLLEGRDPDEEVHLYEEADSWTEVDIAEYTFEGSIV